MRICTKNLQMHCSYVPFRSRLAVLLHCRTSGKLFDLSRFRAKSKVRRLFIRELLYADKATFVATSTSTLQNLCSSFASACAEFHTTISLSKAVGLSQGPCSSPHISINGAVLQPDDEFCYQGSTVDNTNSLKSELDIRIGKAATTFGQLRPRVWSNGNLSIRVKIQVYMSCVVGVLLYGCETWTTYRHQERRLNAFHMRCLRSILGLSWKDRVPNTLILQTTGSCDLITTIRHRRLRWAGHVCRMEDNRLPKQVLYSEPPDAPRPIGRPKLRFRNVLKRDLNTFSITSISWEKLASNKREWKSAIESGKQT